MSESSQLAQMAERLKRNADVQRSNTERTLNIEIEKLQSDIRKASESAASFYSDAMQSINRRSWISRTLSMLLWLSAFVMGCALTAWLCLSDRFGIYSKSSEKLLVQTYTLPNIGSGWTMCQEPPLQVTNGRIMCKVSE